MVEDAVFNLIREKFSIENVSKDMSLENDFDVDSIAALELIMDVEEEFDIEIADEDIENSETVGDIIDYIENKK